MKLFFVLFVAIIATSQAESILDVALKEWSAFKREFNRTYDEKEELNRMGTFFERYSKVLEHNENYKRGLVSYKLTLNKFADIPHEELSRTLHGYRSAKELPGSKDSSEEDDELVFVPPKNVIIPDFVDWSKKGAVTAVKDQHLCGCCWAFSSTGALEGQHFIKTGKLVSLSEQNLMDCVGNNDCTIGGNQIFAFTYVKNNRGIDTEEAYPYEGRLGECRYDSKSRGADDVGYAIIREGNEEDLKIAVATVGPIAAGIDAHHESFKLYEEGIYHEPDCSKTMTNHAVLIVGYGTDDSGKDYWIVKNSWGHEWGEKGYVKIARNENMCGIANDALYPLVNYSDYIVKQL